MNDVDERLIIIQMPCEEHVRKHDDSVQQCAARSRFCASVKVYCYRMAERQEKQRGLMFHLIDITLNIVIIVAIVATIRTFVVSPFQVEGNSMSDTLVHKEYIVINKFRYLFNDPSRGDIVVFRPVGDASKYYVKRVIGLPGDTIIIRDGRVYLRKDGEDVEFTEAYLSDKNAGRTYRAPISTGDEREIVFNIPDTHYFLLGDNRLGSLDSRSFADEQGLPMPYVPRENIKGSVWFVALPVTKIHALEPPQYNL